MILASWRTIGIFPGMTVVQMIIGRTRSTMRKAAVILAATQVMLGTVPLSESASRSTSAHVEAAGVEAHHAHNEESCIACVAIKVFGSAEVTNGRLFSLRTQLARATPRSHTFDTRLASGPPRSRAPPSLILG